MAYRAKRINELTDAELTAQQASFRAELTKVAFNDNVTHLHRANVLRGNINLVGREIASRHIMRMSA